MYFRITSIARSHQIPLQCNVYSMHSFQSFTHYLLHYCGKPSVHCLQFPICASRFREQGCWLEYAQMVAMRVSVLPYHSTIIAWHLYFGYGCYAVQARASYYGIMLLRTTNHKCCLCKSLNFSTTKIWKLYTQCISRTKAMLVQRTCFLLGSLASFSHSLPKPAPAPSPPNNLIQCTPNQPRMIRIPPPTFQSCAVALRALPSFQELGTFHARDPADTFQLPVKQSSGSCTVIVELAGSHQTETASGLEVGLVANQLNMACVDTGDDPARMGGWTTSGRANGIVVTVRETLTSGNWTMVGR